MNCTSYQVQPNLLSTRFLTSMEFPTRSAMLFSTTPQTMIPQWITLKASSDGSLDLAANDGVDALVTHLISQQRSFSFLEKLELHRTRIMMDQEATQSQMASGENGANLVLSVCIGISFSDEVAKRWANPFSICLSDCSDNHRETSYSRLRYP